MCHVRSLAVFATLLASTLGVDPEPTKDPLSGSTSGNLLEDTCFFSFPTFSCIKKCDELGKEPYCHDQTKACLCRDKDAQLEPTEEESSAPSTQDSNTVYSPAIGKVVKMEDYCIFGEMPSLHCLAKCARHNLESYCGAASKMCLCKQLGAEAPSPPPQHNYCWFGEWPSTECRLRCGENEAYCVHDSPTNECLCREEQETQTQLYPPTFDVNNDDTNPSETEDTESPIHFMHFILNLGGLLNPVGDRQNDDHECSMDNDVGEDKVERNHADADDELLFVFGGVPGSSAAPEVNLATATVTETQQGITREQLWTLQTVAASGIIVILLALLAIELYSLYSRKRAQKGVTHVFNSLPPPKTITKT